MSDASFITSKSVFKESKCVAMSDIIFSYASDCTIGCGDFVLSICSHLLFTWKYKVTFSAKYRLDVLVGSEYGQVW